MTTQSSIQVKDLKVGQELGNAPASQYGQYINRVVDSIRITKAGRFVVTLRSQYKHTDGTIDEPKVRPVANGAVGGNYELYYFR